MANYYIGLDWVECLFITEMMTRQELTNQFIPFLIQSFRGDKFLFGNFEKWRKILAEEKITEFDFDWNEYDNFAVDFGNNYCKVMQDNGYIAPFNIYIVGDM